MLNAEEEKVQGMAKNVKRKKKVEKLKMGVFKRSR